MSYASCRSIQCEVQASMVVDDVVHIHSIQSVSLMGLYISDSLFLCIPDGHSLLYIAIGLSFCILN